MPKVSIGLPVYNGERYLGEAIRSILRQNFDDFELVISDNASTDRTEEICRSYMATDGRIRYVRQPRNLGAAPNFNAVFHLAHPGAWYFRWHAHDDVLYQGYLAACVGALDRDPFAVLAQTRVARFDAEGNQIECVLPFTRMDDANPIHRFAQRAREKRCLEIFGMIRKRALLGSEGIGPYIGMDRILLLELALRGRFVLVNHTLFGNRDHPDRCSRVTRRRSRVALAAIYAGADTQRAYSSWSYLAAGLRVISRNVPGSVDRVRCAWHLARSMGAGHTWAFLAIEPLMALAPDAYAIAKKAKRRLLPRRRRRA